MQNRCFKNSHNIPKKTRDGVSFSVKFQAEKARFRNDFRKMLVKRLRPVASKNVVTSNE